MQILNVAWALRLANVINIIIIHMYNTCLNLNLSIISKKYFHEKNTLNVSTQNIIQLLLFFNKIHTFVDFRVIEFEYS